MRVLDFGSWIHSLSSLLTGAGRFAGSDTTAMAFRAIFYFLVKNPEAYGKLQTEVDEVQREGKFGTFLEFQQANKMSYL